MRAAFLTETGPPSVIQVGELPVPVAGPTDVLVRVESVSVNPVDTFVRSGAFPTRLPLPFVVGRDAVGVVEQAGPGSGFEAGRRVWVCSLGHAGRQGPTAELAVAAADRTYPLPEGLDADLAVAVFHPAATAWLALHRHARVRAGERVLVGGGGGNVGSALVELAVGAGARVVATARPDDHRRLLSLGARAAVDYTSATLEDELTEAAAGGFDVAVDCSGTNALWPQLYAHGARVVLVAERGPQPRLPTRSLYGHDVSLLGFAISNASVDDLAAAAAAINDRLAAGGLQARVTERLPLEGIAEAHRMVERGVRGRVVVHPAD